MTSDDRPPVGSNTDEEHPAARFAADCALQLDICSSLLVVADSLPGPLNATAIDVLVRMVPKTWTSHLTLQGDAILPLIWRRHEGLFDLRSRFTPLTKQHIEISAVNDELVECFEMVARGEPVEGNMLGYLIRHAAERRREHVDWEKTLLGPLLPQTLTPAERRMFSEWAAANPWPFDGFEALPTADPY